MEFGQSDNDVHTTEGAAKAYVNMFTLDHVRPLLEKKNLFWQICFKRVETKNI